MMATCASISALMWCKNTGTQNDLTKMTLLHQEAIKLYYCSAPLYWRSAWLHEHIIAVSQLAEHASRKPTSPFTKIHQGDSVDKRPELQSKKKSLAISSSGHSSTDEAVKSLSFTGPLLQTAHRLSRLQTEGVSGLGWKFPLKWE